MCLNRLRERLGGVKEIVMPHFHRFYPPILVFDLALRDQYGECRTVAEILASELEMHGAYLGFLKYYFNAPHDTIEGDFERNIKLLKALKGDA